MNKGPKVLIFGRNGYLARQYALCFKGSVAVSGADITRRHEIEAAIRKERPDVVINAAAITHGWGKNNTSGCDVNEESRRVSWEVNAVGAGLVAEQCAEQGPYLIHLSTGSVFKGMDEREFTEEDLPTKDDQYVRTKIEGDKRVVAQNAGAVLRIQMPLAGAAHQGNLITKLLNAQEIMDIRVSVTVIPSLLEATRQIIDQRLAGIYNVVNSPATSPVQIMLWYCSEVKHSQSFKTVSRQKAVQRGFYNCVLSTAKLKAAGIVLPPTEDAVKGCLKVYPRGY